MSAQHTPGPWTNEGQGDITGIENDPANSCVGKVDVACVYLRTVPGRHEANARLISAAPDLLAALSGILAVASVRIDDPRIAQWDAARAAIAKATTTQAQHVQSIRDKLGEEYRAGFDGPPAD